MSIKRKNTIGNNELGNKMTLAREPKQCFFLLSGRRHLGGEISKAASGRLSEALWELSGELSGSWGGHGGYKGILDRKCCKFNMFYYKNKKEIQFRLGFLGVGVTIVCVLQHFSADAEPE